MSNSQLKVYNKHLSEQQFLELFTTIYSFPKLIDLIRHNTVEQGGETLNIQTIHKSLISVLEKFQHIPAEQLVKIMNSPYSKAQVLIKEKILEQVQLLYPNQTNFNIIYYINLKLEGRYEKQCQQLLFDLMNKNKLIQVKKQIRNFIEKKFKIYDIDGSGDINFQQLQERLDKLNLPKFIANQIMENADQQKNGVLSFKQFKDYTQNKILNYYRIFFNLDEDNDCLLNYHQAKQSLYQIYPGIPLENAVFDKIFKTMDQDRTSFINFEEWCEFLIVFPHKTFNKMVCHWGMFVSTMIVPGQSSSFLNSDLIKEARNKNGERILSYKDILRTLIFGAIAGGVSRTITAPLQRLKIIYQTMYTTSQCPSILTGLRQSYTKNGIASLFKGNSISIFLSCLEQAMRFSIIQYSKKSYEVNCNKIKPHEFLFIGIITGVLSSLVLFPFEVLRVRYITSEGKSVLHQISQIHQTSGPKGFYSGLVPHLISVLPASSFNVMSYNILRNLLVSEKDNQNPKIYKFMFIGGVAALITNTCIYPLSLITSRLIMANKEIKLYKDKIKTHQMIKKIYQGQGFFGFYKGFSANLLRVFIGQSFNFGIYQTLKSAWTFKNDLFNSMSQSKCY